MKKRNSRRPSARTPHPRVKFEIRNSKNENRNTRAQNISPKRHFSSFDFRVLIFALFLLAGCGAPGEPTPPSPPVPVAVADLSARQSGDGVQLTFALPAKTIHGDRLTESPSI